MSAEGHALSWIKAARAAAVAGNSAAVIDFLDRALNGPCGEVGCKLPVPTSRDTERPEPEDEPVAEFMPDYFNDW